MMRSVVFVGMSVSVLLSHEEQKKQQSSGCAIAASAGKAKEVAARGLLWDLLLVMLSLPVMFCFQGFQEHRGIAAAAMSDHHEN